MSRARREKGKRPYQLEADEQKLVVQWCRAQGLRVVAGNNGAHLAGGARSWNRLKALGANTGFPDLIVYHPDGEWYVEMKRRRGAYRGPAELAKAVTEQEREWIDWLTRRGEEVRVCWGADEAIGWLGAMMGWGRVKEA